MLTRLVSTSFCTASLDLPVSLDAVVLYLVGLQLALHPTTLLQDFSMSQNDAYHLQIHNLCNLFGVHTSMLTIV